MAKLNPVARKNAIANSVEMPVVPARNPGAAAGAMAVAVVLFALFQQNFPGTGFDLALVSRAPVCFK